MLALGRNPFSFTRRFNRNGSRCWSDSWYGCHFIGEGVEHTNDPNHWQFDRMRHAILSEKPGVILYEHDPVQVPDDMSSDEAVVRHGEIGFLYAVVRDFSETKYLPYKPQIRSWDQPIPLWIQAMQENGFTNDQIGAYRTLLTMYGWYRPYRKHENYIPQRDAEALYCEYAASDDMRAQKLAASLSLLPRPGGASWTLDHIKDEYEKMAHKPFSFATLDIPGDVPNLFSSDNNCREMYALEQIYFAARHTWCTVIFAGDYHLYSLRARVEWMIDHYIMQEDVARKPILLRPAELSSISRRPDTNVPTPLPPDHNSPIIM